MAGGNPGLEMIRAQLVAGGGLAQMFYPTRDHGLIPSRTILLFESKDVTFGIHSRGKARGVEQHERDQRVGAGLIPNRMFRQQSPQANRFLTKVLLDQVVAARRFVAFVEKQIKRLQYPIQTPGKFCAGRYLEWNVLVADLLFGPR